MSVFDSWSARTHARNGRSALDATFMKGYSNEEKYRIERLVNDAHAEIARENRERQEKEEMRYRGPDDDSAQRTQSSADDDEDDHYYHRSSGPLNLTFLEGLAGTILFVLCPFAPFILIFAAFKGVFLITLACFVVAGFLSFLKLFVLD